MWIEIGNPSARKLHKASKASKKVKVYTYKNPRHLLEDIQNNNVHRSQDIEIYALAPDFLERLAKLISRESRWIMTHDESSFMIACGEETLESEISKVN